LPVCRLAGMSEPGTALLRHRYHSVEVKRVVRETDEARSFTLDVPADLVDTFRYRPGQFCSFRVTIGEDEHARCYSLSSAPETDGDPTVTVKRVPGGMVSNWLVDHVVEGSVIEVNPPSGSFCVREGERPIVAFCGGSGITPVISIAKSVLATSSRPVKILYANRDRDAVIFWKQLEEMHERHPDQLEVHHHLDLDQGFVDATAIHTFVGASLDADFYICGPGPFMELVESTLVDLGVGTESIAIERFETTDADVPRATEDARSDAPDSIVVILRGRKHELAYHAGDTVLETARRANVATPYSCEAGNCATCMAFVQEGTASMRVNDALSADEVEEGWVLTCQAQPSSRSFIVEYEPL